MDKNNRKHVLIVCSNSCQVKGRVFKKKEKVVLYQKHSFPYKAHSYLRRLKN